MKINFVSYLNPFKFNGGGEQVNKELIQSGMDRGHEFTFTSARNKSRNYSDYADFDFLVDIFNYPETLKSGGSWIRFNNSWIDEIVKNRPFIHLTNAYTDICNLGYLPCSGISSNPCLHKSKVNLKRNVASLDFQQTCFSQKKIIRDSFLNSLVNVYVSPLHKKTTNNVLGIDDSEKSVILKPLINTKVFTNQGLTRDIDYLFVGVVSEAKGFNILKRDYSDKNLFIIGDVHPSITLDFGNYLGKVPYSDIPRYMNRARNFVFLPRWPEPQGRVVVEAALSGCNLIVNENVGAMSFPFDLSKPENVEGAATLFWEELESKIAL
jgi:glycosyltransferase involved in cell wall biosynthesis